MADISLVNVCKTYKGGQNAVKDFNLDIRDRELIIFVGPSGCGKSTTLRMIAGLEDISSGELWMDDCLMNMVEPKNRNLSMVFQNYALYPHMTVYENIAFAMHVTNIGRKQIKERVGYMLELVHLEDKANVYPEFLSGGEQQRVAVARALAHAPKLVIADEPTGNIDPELSLEMMELLERVSEMGITVLVVTHEHELVRHFDRRVVTLSGGHIISDVPTGSMIPHPPVDPKELEMEVSLV